ncbi:precorrin-2 dehydrogenase/sirohydrochlorin ferrochelatase family protein [Sporohalobacter salinus]|uniref:precorrin-2 dehydrogenase/sirohydrochlorin ferrochelatase family protein n=1 Tax=Sporohalobacter salinus TaxID=1494606 RepID=UPI00196190AA|nr:bifunctional precorrin-2 dehydrogenase/sirohydrochlorin ferrochelatase [Sporohalobacter salinus]MBM7623079.1 precorrin-2 dehydrogenase/sirohydrochlorin ferrochelatase [Sporohalobacter salinus]
MAKYYPLALDLVDKKVLVVGGGTVAERKVQPLLESEAEVTVISPELTFKLKEQVEEGLISYKDRGYRSTDIEGKFLVIGATDNLAINKQIAEDGLAQNLLVNIVDQPEISNFNVPAVVRQGSLCLSISTDGKSPALSGRIRRELEEEFGPEYKEFLDIMGKLRVEIISRVDDSKVRRRVFKELAYSEIIDYIEVGDYKKVKELINNILPEEIELEEVTNE